MEIYFSKVKLYICHKLFLVSCDKLDLLKKEIVMLMDEAMTNAINMGYDIREVDSARFALYALIDEKLLETEKYSKIWGQISLQESFYDVTNAGSIFYRKLKEDLRLNRKSAWVYWWCLLAGFKGEYCRVANMGNRNRIISEVYKACCKI